MLLSMRRKVYLSLGLAKLSGQTSQGAAGGQLTWVWVWPVAAGEERAQQHLGLAQVVCWPQLLGKVASEPWTPAGDLVILQSTLPPP